MYYWCKNNVFLLSQIELDVKLEGNYDESNQVVLPSQKRKTKIKRDKTETTRILSKKQRKLLEKVVEKKRKKESVRKKHKVVALL